MKYNSNKNQQGAVLAIGLILLLVLSLIGVTNMNKVSTSEHLAGNERDVNLAFQAAEAALREGERVISNLTGSAPAAQTCSAGNCDCAGGSCKTTIWADTNTIWKNNDLDWASKSRILSDDNNAGNDYGKQTLAEFPRYVIEYVDVKNFSATVPIPLYYYRITAIAKGSTAESEVILQSVYRRAFQ